jgi:ABC-type glutathione transport system ATPase component
MTLLAVEDLRIAATSGEGRSTPVVHGVSFALAEGEALGLVGESGSGKTLTLRALAGLLPHGTAVTGGRVLLGGDDVCRLGERELTRLRGARVGMVFQDAATSLDPVMRVGAQIGEGARAHLGASRGEARRRAVGWLERVGIADPERCSRSYPHELSGGMRQRVAIAMALVCEPRLLLCDEPTTALDVTVQAQILDLIVELTTAAGAGLVFVTHDLPVAAQVTDRVAVMRAGHVVEAGPTDAVFAAPTHGYTRALLHAVPTLHPSEPTGPTP